MSNADAVIAALRTGHDSLADVIRDLSDDELARTSGATDWAVSDVLSHLGSGAEITAGSVRGALAGGSDPGRESNEAIWDRWNARSPREQADGFLEASGALTELFESLDAATRDDLRIDIGFMPEPVDVAFAARLRLNELTLHSWDTRVAFDDAATLPLDATAVLLHDTSLLGFIGKSAPLNGEYAVLEVTTSEPAAAFALVLNERIGVETTVPSEPAGTLALPAEAWLRLVAGRLAPERTPSGVTTSGAADVELLRQVFPGY